MASTEKTVTKLSQAHWRCFYFFTPRVSRPCCRPLSLSRFLSASRTQQERAEVSNVLFKFQPCYELRKASGLRSDSDDVLTCGVFVVRKVEASALGFASLLDDLH